jgi:hypothetical protein
LILKNLLRLDQRIKSYGQNKCGTNKRYTLYFSAIAMCSFVDAKIEWQTKTTCNYLEIGCHFVPRCDIGLKNDIDASLFFSPIKHVVDFAILLRYAISGHNWALSVSAA